MARETTITMICDRCGSRHDMSKYMDGKEWGQLNVRWSGDIGSRTWDGTAAGCDIRGTAWLCFTCTNEFQHFMAAKEAGK